jgi:predicted membrane channel-forming protein YqfA (hemolysin III family)
MRYWLQSALIFIWAFWFGGMVALIIFVSHLFALDRNLAKQAAPPMFLIFERMQIFLAIAGVGLTVALRLGRRTRGLAMLTILLALAGGGALLSSIFITPSMEQLRLAGLADTTPFAHLHGESMTVYSFDLLFLMSGGLCLPTIMRDRQRGR